MTPRTMRLLAPLLLLLAAVGPAAAQHNHGAAPEAFTATPAFGPDGTLFVVRAEGSKVLLARSTDLGKTFSAPVSLTPAPVDGDWGPDSRPQLAVTPQGRIVATWAIFQDKRFNARVFFTSSNDGGATFAVPQPVTPDATSQRFQSVAVDSDGKVFAAWLDKRNVAAATGAGRPYAGAALAFAWSDGATNVGETRIAVDNTCECCRLGLAFAGPGKPAVIFRNIFPGSMRDHAVITFIDPDKPGPVRRVSNDNWKTEACPHHGPSLAIAADGSYHAAWFTQGSARQGLYYARADNADGVFSPPRALGQPNRQPARPYVLAAGNVIHLVWKEFDGSKSQVRWQVSRDGGKTFTAARSIAETADASDHPLLVARGATAHLSWLTKLEGYRLVALEETP